MVFILYFLPIFKILSESDEMKVCSIILDFFYYKMAISTKDKLFNFLIFLFFSPFEFFLAGINPTIFKLFSNIIKFYDITNNN